MVKKFYIFSCAALVAILCLFPQDAGATARQSGTTALAPGAGAGATIRLAQGDIKKRKSAAKKGKKTKTPKIGKKENTTTNSASVTTGNGTRPHSQPNSLLGVFVQPLGD